MVTFSTVDEADEAIEKLNGEDGIELTLASAVSPCTIILPAKIFPEFSHPRNIFPPKI